MATSKRRPRRFHPLPTAPEPGLDARILLVRGQRIILDADLARLYGVTSKRLKEQVGRNAARFPGDFAFRLSREETKEVAAICGDLRNLRFARGLPLAFTEHGAVMAAGVLNSPRAVEMSVLVVRAFVRMRRLLAAHEELAGKVAELERRVGVHDVALRGLVGTIRRLIEPPPGAPGERIGFR